MKKLLLKFVIYAKIVWLLLRLRHAARRADMEYAKHKERYYIMPDALGRLVVMRRNGMRRLRRIRFIDRRVRMENVLRESFYITPDRTGIPVSIWVLREKIRMYLRFYLTHHDKNLVEDCVESSIRFFGIVVE